MPARHQAKRGAVSSLFGLLFACAFLALGGWLIATGRLAFVEQFAEPFLGHSLDLFVSPLGVSDLATGRRVMEGVDAQYWACGLISLGAMLCFWGLGIAGGMITGAGKDEQPSAFGRAVTWLSFTCFLLAALCIFPPWRAGGSGFHLAAALLIGTFAYAMKTRRPGLPKRIVPGVLIAIFVTGSFGFVSLCASLVFGLLAAFVAGVHILILAPHLMKSLPKTKEREPGPFDD